MPFKIIFSKNFPNLVKTILVFQSVHNYTNHCFSFLAEWKVRDRKEDLLIDIRPPPWILAAQLVHPNGPTGHHWVHAYAGPRNNRSTGENSTNLVVWQLFYQSRVFKQTMLVKIDCNFRLNSLQYLVWWNWLQDYKPDERKRLAKKSVTFCCDECGGGGQPVALLLKSPEANSSAATAAAEAKEIIKSMTMKVCYSTLTKAKQSLQK